jgi:hypothetical protein
MYQHAKTTCTRLPSDDCTLPTGQQAVAGMLDLLVSLILDGHAAICFYWQLLLPLAHAATMGYFT